MSFILSSPVFNQGEDIPDLYTCRGKDVSPPLHWTGTPDHTRSLALICDDPDAPVGVWDHWILFNIPPSLSLLAENTPAKDKLENGAIHGKNSWGRNDYGGPCPPSGKHRYRFYLYALDSMLDLQPGATKAKVKEAMQGHILAQSELLGYYQKK